MGWNNILPSSEVQEWNDKIINLLDDEDYSFAMDFLEDVKRWILKHNYVTDKQKDAIRNIEESVAQQKDLQQNDSSGLTAADIYG